MGTAADLEDVGPDIGIGGVVSQVVDGVERPVMFVSRVLRQSGTTLPQRVRR